MREMKFEIVLQHEKDKDFIKEQFTYLQLYDGTAKMKIEIWGEDGYVVIGKRQYTGLKDKNGKEIYKGDIVKFHDHPTGVEDGIGAVYWQAGKWMVQWSMIPLGDFGTAWTEVIGNIYENPELLK